MTDIELWTRILKGDKVAFEELYHRYYSPLFGYALLSELLMKKQLKIVCRICLLKYT